MVLRTRVDPKPITLLSEGDRVQLLGLRLDVMEVPGHTAGHMAYFCPETPETPFALLR